MLQSLFLVLSLVGLLAALGTVLARNLVHAALYLVGYFFIVACVFVMLDAEFLAAIQVLVYIGAVAILMMFGIMLTRNVQGDDTTTVPRGWTWPGLVAALFLFAALCFGINNHVGLRGRGAWSSLVRRPPLTAVNTGPASLRTATVNDMGKAVGDELLTRYAVAFEVAGLLLTAAVVGAVALAHRDGEDEAEANSRAAAARLGESPGGNGKGGGNGQVVTAGSASGGGV